jgi:hypothetical protein
METANTVILDALQNIVVQASEASIEADEAQTAIRLMNRYMARLDAQGIDLGYTKVSNLADPITIPDGAIDGLISGLSLSLAPQYDVPITPALILQAKAGVQAMLALSFTVGQTSYGDTLPIGSGNEDDSTYRISHFYPDDPDNVLSEATGSIGLESETAENT